MPNIPPESHPVAVILYCGICGSHEEGKPLELKKIHDALSGHLEKHHKNPEEAESNLHGKLVDLTRLDGEINIKLSYSESETKAAIAELDAVKKKPERV